MSGGVSSDELESISEVESKFYLYDLPFAKYSVVNNLNKVEQSLDFYYGLFANLIEQLTMQLQSAHESLK